MVGALVTEWVGILVLVHGNPEFAGTRELHAGRILARLGSPQTLGPLLDYFASKGTGPLRGDDAANMARQLRERLSQNPVQLAERERSALRPILYGFHPVFSIQPEDSRPRAELARVIMEALAAIGDGQDVRMIRTLANMRAFTANGAMVRDSARRWLPVLLERIEEQKPAATLLRPASAGTAESTLLRPAGPAESDTQHLLRPAERES